MQPIRDRAALIAAIANGLAPSFLFFWGHRQKRDNAVDKSALSQWFPAPFTVDGIAYPTAEHFMMAEKARIFGDREARENILASTDPAAAKRLGRTVRNFLPEPWEQERTAIVIEGNLAKFSQNPHLSRFLLSTSDQILVEASPTDSIWGIGLEQSHPDAPHPDRWPGLNLLGFALLEVRSRLNQNR
jgi:ribA/ribD-fused uncharacterized protein